MEEAVGAKVGIDWRQDKVVVGEEDMHKVEKDNKKGLVAVGVAADMIGR